VLKRIFGTKRGKIKERYRKLYDEELYHLNSSLGIIGFIRSRVMKSEENFKRRNRSGQADLDAKLANRSRSKRI
jgi:hypothetical protein